MTTTSNVDKLLTAGFKGLGTKPPDSASRAVKQNYSQRMSAAVALALGAELRDRGMREARPTEPGQVAGSGAERRMAGGISPKRVDVTWATEESGLLLAISVKTINFRDGTSGNFQKNLTNRRADLLMESVTLHRRFPFAVLAGLVVLDHQAAQDQTSQRRSTFQNAHARLRLFTGRDDPAERDEQYERLWIMLVDANPFTPQFKTYNVPDHVAPVSLSNALDDLVELLATRNPDFYEAVNGKLRKLRA